MPQRLQTLASLALSFCANFLPELLQVIAPHVVRLRTQPYLCVGQPRSHIVEFAFHSADQIISIFEIRI
jgi:hypothetical protein